MRYSLKFTVLFDTGMNDVSRNHRDTAGSGLWMLGAQGRNAEWYNVPAGGQVNLTLTEQWGIADFPSPSVNPDN
jgi:hypothetical protein